MTTIPIWIFALTVAMSALPESPPEDWQSELEEVLEEAESDGKPVLVEFTAVWCGYCKRMRKETLTDEQVLAELDKYIGDLGKLRH